MAKQKIMPENIKQMKLRSQCDSIVMQCKSLPNLLYSSWLDKKFIHIISTNCKNEPCLTTRRKGSEKHIVPCPPTFVKYNKNMGGVDLADQC
ncbi:hypothetical protein X975_04968, partial [Stegodyphus mimosarum]